MRQQSKVLLQRDGSGVILIGQLLRNKNIIQSRDYFYYYITIFATSIRVPLQHSKLGGTHVNVRLNKDLENSIRVPFL